MLVLECQHPIMYRLGLHVQEHDGKSRTSLTRYIATR
jgi:hypothetical protein